MSAELVQPIDGTDSVLSLGLIGWTGTLSPHTARAYAADLGGFTVWLARSGTDPTRLTPGHINAWLADLAAVGNGASTRARKLSAVKSFYRYLQGQGEDVTVPTTPAPKVHRDESNLGALSRHQVHQLWEVTEGQARARALVAVLMFSGLRISEALGITVADLQEERGERVARVLGKGSKPRSVVLAGPTVEAIGQWLDERGRQAGYLFSTRSGKPMDSGSAYLLIARLGKLARINGLHPHALRHTYATGAVEAGADIFRLQRSMGHSSPNTTMAYVRDADDITGSPVNAVTSYLLS